MDTGVIPSRAVLFPFKTCFSFHSHLLISQLHLDKPPLPWATIGQRRRIPSFPASELFIHIPCSYAASDFFNEMREKRFLRFKDVC